jgi:GxxExxY protein
MSENQISYIIRGAIFEIYNHFGPGLFEQVYKEAMFVYIQKKGIEVQKEVGIAANYLSINLGIALRMDLLVGKKVIVECKSIECLGDIHKKQLLTYLKLTGLKLGILVNFNTDKIENSIIRVVNNL